MKVNVSLILYNMKLSHTELIPKVFFKEDEKTGKFCILELKQKFWHSHISK